jgi:hypothetical protein
MVEMEKKPGCPLCPQCTEATCFRHRTSSPQQGSWEKTTETGFASRTTNHRTGPCWKGHQMLGYKPLQRNKHAPLSDWFSRENSGSKTHHVEMTVQRTPDSIGVQASPVEKNSELSHPNPTRTRAFPIKKGVYLSQNPARDKVGLVGAGSYTSLPSKFQMSFSACKFGPNVSNPIQ